MQVQLQNREGTPVTDARLLLNGVEMPYVAASGAYTLETEMLGPFDVKIAAPGYRMIEYRQLPYVPATLYVLREGEDYCYVGRMMVPGSWQRDRLLVILRGEDLNGVISPDEALRRFHPIASRLRLTTQWAYPNVQTPIKGLDPSPSRRYAVWATHEDGSDFESHDLALGELRRAKDAVAFAGPSFSGISTGQYATIGGHRITLRFSSERDLDAGEALLRTDHRIEVFRTAFPSEIVLIVVLPLSTAWGQTAEIDKLIAIPGVLNVEIENWKPQN